MTHEEFHKVLWDTKPQKLFDGRVTAVKVTNFHVLIVMCEVFGLRQVIEREISGVLSNMPGGACGVMLTQHQSKAHGFPTWQEVNACVMLQIRQPEPTKVEIGCESVLALSTAEHGPLAEAFIGGIFAELKTNTTRNHPGAETSEWQEE
jgi:hypothetical protein